MRISTSSLYQSGLARINDLQASLAKTQMQLSTNKRIVNPSDDPVAAARALNVEQAKALNERLSTNRDDARSALNLQEGTLSSVTTLLQNVKTSIVQAGNSSLSDSDRKSLATSLRGQLDSLIGLANSRDGEGNYMFAGYQNSTAPFVATATGAQYVGDQGVRTLQVGQARSIAISDTGDALFMGLPATNAFNATAAAANTGSASTGAVTVVDPSLLQAGHQYSIDFSGGGTAFSVYDLTNDPGKTTPLSSSGTYTSGQPISFDGLQVTVSGAVADGDSFTVQPAPKQDVFSTLSNLVDLLNKPVVTPADRASLDYGLSAANTNVDTSLNNVLTARSSLGARLSELDALDSMGDDLGVQYETTLQSLTGLDLAKAITDLTMQKTNLEAAQQAFVKISGLSLFNYIS